jgi:hypothetical protein
VLTLMVAGVPISRVGQVTLDASGGGTHMP